MSADPMHNNRRQGGKKKGSAGKPRARAAVRSARPEELAVAEPAARPPASPPRSVVGVGASAGGLEAFTQLLRALPVDTGMAFVLVQHLSPTHQSALAEILSRATTMPVTEVVADEPELEPNHVYVIPPDRNMILVHERLRLLRRDALGKQHPIDRFFRSLAESQRHMAIGVVLSGTATDGTLGMEEIKAEGGITFAQDESAQQRGMPQSAVASGCVDFVLAPAAIAVELARISKHPYVAGRP
ncbi:MAG TPA: chemotaxis protein CheB, partial [Candidatus Limnocylindrales bacterium]|nr:chemotaxis protein CheB [Candidatus Limnocylindrales bacterium]